MQVSRLRILARVLDAEDRHLIGQAAAFTIGGGGLVIGSAFVLGLAFRVFQSVAW